MGWKRFLRKGIAIIFCAICYFSLSNEQAFAQLSPVKITTFTARYVPEIKSINLHWVTLKENHPVQYIIERSLDSLHFRMIGETMSEGGAEEEQRNYYFTDSRPIGGGGYYRIREIIDSSEQFTTKAIKVQTPIAQMELAQLFLSPDNKELSFAIVSPDSIQSSILVSDVNGNIQSTYILGLKRGPNMHSIYTGNLPPGVYFLQINNQDDESSIMRKFIIQTPTPPEEENGK